MLGSLSGPGTVTLPSPLGLTVTSSPVTVFGPGTVTVPSGLTVEPFGTVTGLPSAPGVVTVPPSGKVTPPSGVIVGFCVASGLGVTVGLS